MTAERRKDPQAAAAGRGVLSTERALKVTLFSVQLGPVVILLVLFGVLTALSPLFMTASNMRNVAVQSSVVAILALGQLLVILTAGIDLSVGSVLALTTVTGALAFSFLAPGGALVVPVMLATGIAVGLFNGTLFVKGRMPHPFIPTLAMLNIARGVALQLSDGRPMPGMPDAVVWLGSGFVGPIPVPTLVVAVLALLALLLTRRTRWGRWIYAVGGDKEAARRAGIPVDRVLISVYVLAGLAAGFAGVVTAGRTNSGYPTAGQLAELDSIAAVIIGGASFFGGRGRVTNVLIGALILGGIRNGLNLLGVDAYWQLVIVGFVVIIAVQLDVLRRWLEGRFRSVQAAK